MKFLIIAALLCAGCLEDYDNVRVVGRHTISSNDYSLKPPTKEEENQGAKDRSASICSLQVDRNIKITDIKVYGKQVFAFFVGVQKIESSGPQVVLLPMKDGGPSKWNPPKLAGSFLKVLARADISVRDDSNEQDLIVDTQNYGRKSYPFEVRAGEEVFVMSHNVVENVHCIFEWDEE